jgi:hypothetical protein
MFKSIIFPMTRTGLPYLCVLSWLLCGEAARAGTVTNLPAADTTLFETAPDNNLGAGTLAAGATRGRLRARALLRFDLSGVPANAVVVSATLRFNDWWRIQSRR